MFVFYNAITQESRNVPDEGQVDEGHATITKQSSCLILSRMSTNFPLCSLYLPLYIYLFSPTPYIYPTLFYIFLYFMRDMRDNIYNSPRINNLTRLASKKTMRDDEGHQGHPSQTAPSSRSTTTPTSYHHPPPKIAPRPASAQSCPYPPTGAGWIFPIYPTGLTANRSQLGSLLCRRALVLGKFIYPPPPSGFLGERVSRNTSPGTRPLAWEPGVGE